MHSFALDFFARYGYASPLAFDQSLTYDEAIADLDLTPTDLAQRALGDDEKRVHLLFQFTADQLKSSNSLFAAQPDKTLFETFVFVALDLRDGHYSRSDLAALARQINTPFASPVIVLFRHGPTLSLASVARRQSLNDDTKHVLQKVSMLKDIGIGAAIHPAHFQILNELAGAKTGAHNWTEFLARWNAVLDISELNKRFFRELSDWYFNARRHCVFPKPASDTKTDDEHISTSLIRLITRVMFSYFLKERDLVPAPLFDPQGAPALLRETDADASTYYKAVLQNLFFATLNTEMDERAWKAPDNKAGYNDEFMVHNKRRYGDFFLDRAAAAALFGRVPFLNGGLFECLDKKEDKRTLRYDGFSERPDNPLQVPNALFWGPDVKVNLAAEYGSTTPVLRNVRPLLPLFAAYKWTVAENTPLEEEVALDPELLGKVFENLLASDNPETKATARKQSGSFYTPREIVDYMVTESLVAYLGAQTEVDAATLRGLFASEGAPVRSAGFSPSPDQFSNTDGLKPALQTGIDTAQTRAIIAAIERLKLLDPAVGSGAFPMGALQSLVALLRKLDPHNQLWRDQLEASARNLTLGSEGALEQIREVWAQDSGDYARKLYLIENCLFGVDIQPIAIQIAKLRFFIALAIEQKGNANPDDNFGIRPLPNLETKLVAANTLLELAGAQLTLSTADIDALQRELERVRHAHFGAQKWAKKKALRDQDAALRTQLAAELKKFGMPGNSAELLAHWNPYDQNASAPFFDPRWMFGLEHGFDIVIGNPPYGAEISKVDADYFKKNYKIQNYQLDTYLLFMERSYNLLKKGGTLGFIIPNTWLSSLMFTTIRRHFFEQSTIVDVVHYKASVFAAVVDAEVLICSRVAPPKEHEINVWIVDPKKGDRQFSMPQSEWRKGDGKSVSVSLDATELMLANKLSKSPLLDVICNITPGTKPFQVGKGKPPQTKKILAEKPFVSKDKKDETFRPLLRGSLIHRYANFWANDYWISFGEWLAEPRHSADYDATEKIIVRQTADTIIATFDDAQFVVRNNLFTVVPKQDCPKLKYVLGVLNSRCISWLYENAINAEKGEALAEVKRGHLAQLPIPAATASQQAEISALVEQILAARGADVGADVSALEARIDARVYALYGLDDGEIALIEGV